MSQDDKEIVYDAKMPLYAISRARVQYLSSCIPLFRFKHSLFEALISSIHESEIRPAYEDVESLSKKVSMAHNISQKQKLDMNSKVRSAADDYSNYFEQHEVLQDPIMHERFLMKKFLEFMSHP